MTRLIWALSSLNLLLWNSVSLLCLAPKTDFNSLMIICDKIKSYLLFNSIFGLLRLLWNNITPDSNAITRWFNSLLACSRHKMVRKTWKRERSRKNRRESPLSIYFFSLSPSIPISRRPALPPFWTPGTGGVGRDLWAISKTYDQAVTKERLCFHPAGTRGNSLDLSRSMNMMN